MVTRMTLAPQRVSVKGEKGGVEAALPSRLLGSIPVLRYRKAVRLEEAEHIHHAPCGVRIYVRSQLVTPRKRIVSIARIEHHPPRMSTRVRPAHPPKRL